MATNTIDLVIRAKQEALIADLQKAGNLSQKTADKVAKEFIKQGKAAEASQARAAKQTEKHWTDATKKIGSALGEGVIPKFEKLSGIGESLGGVMGVSALKVAMLTGGIALAAAGAVKLGSAIVGTIRNVDDLSSSLSGADRQHLAPYIASMGRANDALDRMDDALTGLQIQFASTFSPAVEDAADAIGGFARASQDAYDALSKRFADGTVGGFLFANSGTGQTLAALDALGGLGRAYNSGSGSTRSQRSTSQLAESIGLPPGAPSTVAVTRSDNAELDALFSELSQNLAGYDADRTAKAREESRKRSAGAQAEAERLKAEWDQLQADMWAAEQRANTARRVAEEQRVKEASDRNRELMEQSAALADARIANEKRAAEAAAQQSALLADAAKQTAANVASFASGLGSLISGLYETAADNAEKGSARERKARRAAFATAKAAALVQAGINTALGVTQALTLPVPYNYINAAIVGALGAVEVGVIASKQMPTAHTGRLIGPAPDEQPIMALRGEAVMSRAAVSDMGGEQAVSERNRRVGGGQQQVGMFAMTYEHRSYDAFVRRDLRRPSGVMRQALHNAGTAGLLTRGG